MRQYGAMLAASIGLTLVWPGAAIAQTGAQQQAAAKSEKSEAESLDDEAKTPEGTQRVTQRLASEFNVDQARVQSLRDQGLGYGEVQHALSLSQQMPGGINDDNVKQIMKMRQDQHMGWGQIAHQLGAKLGPARTAPRATGTPATATTPNAATPSAQPPARPGNSPMAPLSPGKSPPGYHHGGGSYHPGNGSHQGVAVHGPGRNAGAHGRSASAAGHGL